MTDTPTLTREQQAFVKLASAITALASSDKLDRFPEYFPDVLPAVLAAARLWLEGPTEAQIERAAEAIRDYQRPASFYAVSSDDRNMAKLALRAAFTPEDTP